MFGGFLIKTDVSFQNKSRAYNYVDVKFMLDLILVKIGSLVQKLKLVMVILHTFSKIHFFGFRRQNKYFQRNLKISVFNEHIFIYHFSHYIIFMWKSKKQVYVNYFCLQFSRLATIDKENKQRPSQINTSRLKSAVLIYINLNGQTSCKELFRSENVQFTGLQTPVTYC